MGAVQKKLIFLADMSAKVGGGKTLVLDLKKHTNSEMSTYIHNRTFLPLIVFCGYIHTTWEFTKRDREISFHIFCVQSDI